MESILSLAKKRTEAAETFVTIAEETSIIFESNKLKKIQSRQSTRITLRVIRNGRCGISAANRFEDADRLVSMAIEAAEFGPRVHFELPGMNEYPQVEIYDDHVNNTSTEKLIGMGSTLIEKLTRHTPELLCEMSINKAILDTSIMNSSGCSSSYKKSVFSIAVEGVLIRGTDMLFVFDVQGKCNLPIDTELIYQTITNQLERAKDNAVIKPGKYPVVFSPYGVVSAFIPSLSLAFNGKMVLQGASPLVTALNKKFFDEALTLTDDPTLPYLLRSRKFDDEGINSQKNTLINKGTVERFLYDLQTAAQSQKVSTGSAVRMFGGMPMPGISNLVMCEGNTPLSQITADIKEGLLVEQLMGAEQGNILGGEFSGNVLLGYKIENGNIIGRVKDTIISGNVYKVLFRLTAISRERETIYGSFVLPYLCCDGIEVASKAG